MAGMTVAQMIELFVEPNAPLRIEAFDGSVFGPVDAPVCIKVNNSRAVYYMVDHPNELGLARAYLQGDISSPQMIPGDPYEVFKDLVNVKPYFHKPDPVGVAKALASVASHGIRHPKAPSI